MIMLVFESVKDLTRNFHSGGGLVVVAETRQHAMGLIREDPDIQLAQEEWDAALEYPLCGDSEPRLFVFPDAGCC